MKMTKTKMAKTMMPTKGISPLPNRKSLKIPAHNIKHNRNAVKLKP